MARGNIWSLKPRWVSAPSPGTMPGITCFRLPTTSAEAAERLILRRIPDAKPGSPGSQVVDAVAAARRYFEGEKAEFSRYEVDLGEQERPSLTRFTLLSVSCNGARRRPTGAVAKELGRRPRSRARCGAGDGEESRPADHPVPSRSGSRRKGRRLFCTRRVSSKARMVGLEGVNLKRPPQRSGPLAFGAGQRTSLYASTVA